MRNIISKILFVYQKYDMDYDMIQHIIQNSLKIIVSHFVRLVMFDKQQSIHFY